MERSDRLEEYATELVSADEVLEMAGPLESLLQGVGWQHYAELMKRSRILSRESLEAAETVEDMNFTRGFIAGLRYAQSLPLTVLQGAKETARAEETRAQRFRGEVFRSTGEESF